MNKKQRRKAAQEEFKKPITKFEQIDLSKSKFIPTGMTRAYRNTRYTVMVYDHSPVSTGTAIRVMVQRHDDEPIPRHWAEMQKIKNQIFGSETTAIEYYPAQSELIDDHNIYWFWIFPEGILPTPSFQKEPAPIPTEYGLNFCSIQKRYRIKIVATSFDENGIPNLFAIKDGECAMSKITGYFDYEPMPSYRDDDFIKEYRFDSFSEALESYKKHQ